jgi:hypothetical protein
MWALRQLLTPCNYLRIRQGKGIFYSKLVYDFVLPVAGTVAAVAICLSLDAPLNLSNQDKFVANLSQLLALMIGFYLAALAAVATLNRDGIDSPLKGEPAKLRVINHDGGQRVDKNLTYRQFICYMFGYLSFLSLILFIVVICAANVWPLIARKINAVQESAAHIDTLVNAGLFILVSFLLSQLFVTSLLAIYFLAERLQTLSDKEN